MPSEEVTKRPGLGLHLVANYAGQGWSAVMNIAFIPVYIHYLGLESYGLIGVFAVVLTAATLLDAGMSPTINRQMALHRAGQSSVQQIRDLLFSVELICLGVLATCLLLAYPLALLLAHYWVTGSTLSPEILRWSLFLMITTASLRVLEGVFRGALLGLQRHLLMNGVSIVFVTLRAAGVIVPLALWNASIQTFFLWQAGVSLLGIVTFVLLVRASLPKPPRHARFDGAAIGALRHFASGVLGAAALGVALSQIDKILLVRLLPLNQFSAYALATAVAAGLYQLTNPVSQSYYPHFTELHEAGDNEQLAVSYHHAAQVVALATAPVGAFLIMCGSPLLELWTGNPALAETAAPLLRLLSIGTMLHCAMYVPYALQLAAGWSKLAARTNMVAVLIFAPALLIIVPKAGATGAAAAWVALNCCTSVAMVQIMHTRLLSGEKSRWYVTDVLGPWSAALLTLALFRIGYPAGSGAMIKLAYFALAGGCATAATAALLPVVRAPLARSLRRLGAGADYRGA